jgi:proteic killer suppression protein
MIQSFGDKETELIWQGRFSLDFPNEIQSIARRKLRMLHNAQDLKDLRIPPANRLEKLTGKLKGYYSSRINQQWRIVFRWTTGNANEVQITDYH